MRVCKALGDLDAQVLGQDQAHHGITGVDLVTQAHHLDGAIASDGVADARHGIGEIDQPGIGASQFHVTHDFHHRADVAGGVRKTARPAVLGVRLAHAILERYLVIHAPQFLAGRDLDSQHHEFGPL